jgi:hypothetical protein
MLFVKVLWSSAEKNGITSKVRQFDGFSMVVVYVSKYRAEVEVPCHITGVNNGQYS